MSTDAAAKRKTETTYDACSDHFDDGPLTFWDRAGRGTVARAALNPGERVLDVCCGTGASAIPAAQVVGPSGSVLAVDLSESLLKIGREKAARRNLGNITLARGDMEALDQPERSFDAAICVFGLFFVEDMERQAAALWRLLKPGGRLAITTWGPKIFEPATTQFWSAVKAERPELFKGWNPWDRIVEPDAVRALFERAGLPAPRIESESSTEPLLTPDDWWTILLGTGYRATIDAMPQDARERVRQSNLSWIRDHKVRAVETNFIYAVAGA